MVFGYYDMKNEKGKGGVFGFLNEEFSPVVEKYSGWASCGKKGRKSPCFFNKNVIN